MFNKRTLKKNCKKIKVKMLIVNDDLPTKSMRTNYITYTKQEMIIDITNE